MMWNRMVVEKFEEFIGIILWHILSRVWKTTFYGPLLVYMGQMDSDRSLLQEELAKIHSWWDLIGSDFNVIRFPNECSRDSRMQPEMTEFLELIFYLTLVNIPLMGGAFTWSNNHIQSRLDGFLVSSEWKNHCPNVCQKRLSHLYSDHFLSYSIVVVSKRPSVF